MSNENGVSEEIAAFFTNPDASSAIVMAAEHVAAPVVQGATLTEDELGKGGGLRVVYHVFDRSPSMEPVGDDLRDGFNNDYVPAIEEAREDDISALRLGGLSFSSDITPIWVVPGGDAIHPLDALPQMTIQDYDPTIGSGTSLHQAILDGTTNAMTFAAQVQAETGLDVDVDIIILTDGANNGNPRDPGKVKKVITGRDRSRVRYVFFYFETKLGLSDPKGYAINDLGIDGEQVQSFPALPNETPEQRRHRFRQLLQVMSRVSAAKNTSAVMATAAVLDDEELV
jgi:hypothetical protein